MPQSFSSQESCSFVFTRYDAIMYFGSALQYRETDLFKNRKLKQRLYLRLFWIISLQEMI